MSYGTPIKQGLFFQTQHPHRVSSVLRALRFVVSRLAQNFLYPRIVLKRTANEIVDADVLFQRVQGKRQIRLQIPLHVAVNVRVHRNQPFRSEERRVGKECRL